MFVDVHVVGFVIEGAVVVNVQKVDVMIKNDYVVSCVKKEKKTLEMIFGGTYFASQKVANNWVRVINKSNWH